MDKIFDLIIDRDKERLNKLIFSSDMITKMIRSSGKLESVRFVNNYIECGLMTAKKIVEDIMDDDKSFLEAVEDNYHIT
jgi:hypothetical protein